MKRWTAAEVASLAELYPHHTNAVLARTFGCSESAIGALATKAGMRKTEEFKREASARGDQFHAGHVPWNKGAAFHAGGRSAETRFKPGQFNGRAAQLVVPIGSYRVNADGILDRKVSDTPGPQSLRWKPVHRLAWEAANGPVPAGHAVVFKPGRRTTDPEAITVDALELVTRAELLRRNSVHRHGPEIARLAQLRGALNRQINKRSETT